MHVASARLYAAVWAALLALTGVTVAVAYVDLGPLNLAVALLIATGKATLVALYFMHVRWSSLPVRLAVVVGVLWLGLVVGGTLDDYLTRDDLPRP